MSFVHLVDESIEIRITSVGDWMVKISRWEEISIFKTSAGDCGFVWKSWWLHKTILSSAQRELSIGVGGVEN